MPLGGFSLQGVSGLALGDFRVEPLRNFWFGLSGISGLSLPGISGLASPEFLVWPFREFLVSPFGVSGFAPPIFSGLAAISWLNLRPVAHGAPGTCCAESPLRLLTHHRRSRQSPGQSRHRTRPRCSHHRHRRPPGRLPRSASLGLLLL